jgi:glutamine amidotransferase
MKKTIAKINAFVKAVPAEHHLADVETRSLLNFAVTDGHSVIVTRYVSSKTDAAASLYYSSGTAWVEGKTKGQFKMERRDKASDVVLVASEPLTFERHNWLSVPTNTIVTICKQTVYVRPIKDEFYVEDPSTERSTGFASSKGLVVKAPGGAVVAPAATASPGPEDASESPLNGHLDLGYSEHLTSKVAALQMGSDSATNGTDTCLSV